MSMGVEEDNNESGSRIEPLFLALPIFHESFILAAGFIPCKNEDVSALPSGLLIGSI